MGSVGLTRCRPPGPAGFRNAGLWLPPFLSPAFFHTQDQVKSQLPLPAPASFIKSRIQAHQAPPPVATHRTPPTCPQYWRMKPEKRKKPKLAGRKRRKQPVQHLWPLILSRNYIVLLVKFWDRAPMPLSRPV